MLRSRVLLITLLLLFAFGAWLLPSQAQRINKSAPGRAGTPSKSSTSKAVQTPKAGGSSVEPIVVRAANVATSPPLSEVAASASVSDVKRNEDEEEAAENRSVRQLAPSSLSRRAASVDPVVQTTAPVPLIPSPAVNFDGLSNQNNATINGFRVSPPDTNGDVGPNHYVQFVNDLVRVYDKTGAPLTPPFRISQLFAPLGGIAATNDNGDGIVLYDPLADRWLISQFAFTALNAPPYHEVIAISKTGDPTGAYFLYDFITPGNEFPDYPHLGVWPDGYYMTVNQFTLGGPFNGTGAYAFDRKKMIVGDPTASLIYFNLNLATHPEGIGGMLPSDLDGLTVPPTGRPNTFAYFTATEFADPADGLRLFDFHADFGTPASSTFTERPESTLAVPLPVAAFDPTTPAGRRDIQEPPPATNTNALDSISDRLMHRLQYRNRGGSETLVVCHTVGAPASTTIGTYRAGVRYYELRRGLPAGSFAVNEQATFAPADGVNRWMGSAAEDNQGNLAVGYSVSSTGVFPGIRYAGRLATDPPNGLFQGEATLIAGTGVQLSTTNRWGDYSAMAVDPSDDCTFWYTQEYYTAASQATSTVGWLTRIGSFKFSQCTAPPMGMLSGTITFCDSGAPISAAIVEVSDGHSSATLANGTYSMKLPPGTYTVTASDPALHCMTSSAATVVITDGGSATFSTCLTGAPLLALGPRTVSGGNGNGVIDLNECNNLSVVLNNVGCSTATNIFAMLSSSTAGVTITQPNSPYPNIPAGGSAPNQVPFSVSTSPSFVCGTPITFTLTVTSNIGTSSFTFTLPTCTCPPTTITGSITATDPTLTPRLFRDGIASTCASPKAACPGTTSTGTRHYDAYTFTNQGGVAACVTARVTSGCGTNLFYSTYLGSFNPANLCQNYLADPGSSFAGTATWSFNVPAGQTFVLVIYEVAIPNTLCASYSATVSGLFCTNDGGGQCVPCSISCPANVSQPNDPDQCGAVVNYPAPASNGTCGVVSCSPASGSFFPVGTTTVTCSTTAGPSCSFTVTVNDTQRPIVTCDVATTTLWPPNHDLINVGLSASATDNCPGTVISVAVFGDEDDETPTGDGTFSPDAKDIGVGTLRLRSERKGDGDGRVYLIIVTATDASGNVSRCCRTVTVTHDQSKASVASVAAQAAAAKAFCEENGTAPPGYFVIGDGPIIGPKQ